jgi:hypothetical protein
MKHKHLLLFMIVQSGVLTAAAQSGSIVGTSLSRFRPLHYGRWEMPIRADRARD